MLNVLRKYRLYANLKKYRFYKDKICFPSYVVFAKEVKIEDKRIEAIKYWPKLTSAKDIQVFICFPNFY